MSDGSKKQISKANLDNYEFANGGNGADSNVAEVRESGTAFEPEQSNYNHFNEPAKVRDTN